ncbi:MAG TPA: cytochrome oxidase small assembly protein [Rhodocyclaceae bacterium]|jgi:hypothetical protein|nr:cytochrome oxidase small assembly protein [Rhodocyclaceae bacterium]
MTAMAHENDNKALRARNVRTGLILAAIVLVLFVSFIVRTWYLAHG